MSTLRVSVDDRLHTQAGDILNAIGLDVNSAVRAFLQGVVLHGGMPFEMRLTQEQLQEMRIRKEANRQATREAREIAAGAGPRFDSVEALIANIEGKAEV